MQYLMLILFATSSFAVSERMRDCMSRLFDRSGMSLQNQEALRRRQAPHRNTIQEARPARNDQHTRARNVREAIELSRRGSPQYMPGLIRERVEARALRDLPGVFRTQNGTTYKFVKFDKAIGFASGKETKWLRVEVSPNGEFHGRPMPLAVLYQQCRECQQIDR